MKKECQTFFLWSEVCHCTETLSTSHSNRPCSGFSFFFFFFFFFLLLFIAEIISAVTDLCWDYVLGVVFFKNELFFYSFWDVSVHIRAVCWSETVRYSQVPDLTSTIYGGAFL